MRRRRKDVQILMFFILALGSAGLFLFFTQSRDIQLTRGLNTIQETATLKSLVKLIKPIEPKPLVDPNADIPPQKPLKNPPEVIKAIYATGWSAGSVKKSNYLINLIKNTELNAIIIDIKDYSGTISYDTDIPMVNLYEAEEIKIRRPNALIKRLHDAGIYVIARQTIFQDPILAGARPDLALTSSSTGEQWKDRSGLMWIDSAAREAWDYNIAIAKDALARGFDEINFDYIRFVSDGNLDDIVYPFWDGITLKRYVMRDFFKYLRKSLPDAQISADLFGLTTVSYGDVGIGQNLDDAFHYFNAVAPMVYPSHYGKGFNGYDNPALHPYGVVYASMLEANERLKIYLANAASSTSADLYLVKKPQLRPWLQDFNLGATYDAKKVRAQIEATYAAAGGTPTGWMLWDSSNIYTKNALINE